MLKSLDTLIGLAVVMTVMSLLVTVITQMISALLGLRGRNLADALVILFHQLDPDLKKTGGTVARRLAHAVLTHPMISDSTLSMCKKRPLWWKLASAIRPTELEQVLTDLAEGTAEAVTPEARGEEVKDTARRVLNRVQTAREASAAALASLNPEAARLVSRAEENATAAFDRTRISAGRKVDQFEKLFGSVQDRAQQWFTMHARVWTIIASLLLALVTQLDLFYLFGRLSSDPALRAGLISRVEGTEQTATNFLQAVDPASGIVSANVVPALKAQHPGIGAQLDNMPSLPSLQAVERWIRWHLAEDPQVDAIIADYRTEAQRQTAENVRAWQQRLEAFGRDVGDAGLPILPSPYPNVFKGEWTWLHLLGMLSGAALLSLGAPFWFNALKGLASLRPLLAQQIDKEADRTSKASA
ncbi:MAG TPA: hypothetical protein VGD78_09750 [Chthoniobacterales bacterium]